MKRNKFIVGSLAATLMIIGLFVLNTCLEGEDTCTGLFNGYVDTSDENCDIDNLESDNKLYCEVWHDYDPPDCEEENQLRQQVLCQELLKLLISDFPFSYNLKGDRLILFLNKKQQLKEYRRELKYQKKLAEFEKEKTFELKPNDPNWKQVKTR